MVKNQLNQQLGQEGINSQFKKRIIGVGSRVGQYSKKLISVFLGGSVLGLVLYVGGGKFANHKLPDRKFEQGVKKDQNGSIDSYAVGDINLGKVIQENNLDISPDILYKIYENERENKTKTIFGGFASDVSEGVRKATPFLWTKNKSFGTWQLQDRAFLHFMDNMIEKEKYDFVMKLASFRIDGESIQKSCGFKEQEIGDFLNYIMKGKYNTEDGNDDRLGRGNGKLGFAMSILMINEMYNIASRNQNNLIEQKYNSNLAASDLMSSNYNEGLLNAYWSTDYVRAIHDAPEQLDQNITIIGLFLKDKIDIADISLNNRGDNDGKVFLNMPDGDKGKIFKANKGFIEQQEILFKDVEDVLKYIDINLGNMSDSKKINLAKLLLASSFETFYFGVLHLNNQSSIKNYNLIDNIINHKQIKEADIDKYIKDLLNDDDKNIDKLIRYCNDALKLSANEDIRRTVPVVQRDYDEFHNEANTLGRFSKGGGGIQIIYDEDNSASDSSQVADSSLILNKERLQGDESKTIIDVRDNSDKSVVIKKGSEEEIKKVLGDNKNHYKKVGSVIVKKGTQGRDIVWGNYQVKGYIIKGKYKDIDGNIITSKTDKSRLPSLLISQFLSLDGKSTIHPSKLNKLYIGEEVYIVLPK